MKKLMTASLFIIILIAGCGVSSNDEAETSSGSAPSNQSDWMRGVHNDPQVYTLDMPGAHDSATYRASFGSYYQCQTKNITDQLNWGVRVLDIRLKMGSEDDVRGFRQLLTAHEDHTYDSFGIILNQCINFLQLHPYETIVMIIKNEGSPDIRNYPTFNDSVEWYLNEACSKNSFGDWKDRFPDTSKGKLWKFTLEDTRQKILLVSHGEKNENEPGWIRRAQALKWSYSSKTDSVTERVQDAWGELYEPFWKFKKIKKEAIESIQISKQAYANNNLIIQHLSASFKQTPYFVANHMFQMFIKDMGSYRQRYRLGWFMMDYIGHFNSEEIRNAIINDSINNTRCVKVRMPENTIIDNPDPIANTLHTNFKLENGHAIVTAGDNPKYGLIMQSDNNLVLYRFFDWYDDMKWGKGGIAIWASGTCGKGTQGKAYADLQSDIDGIFEIYTEQAIWDTGKRGDYAKGDGLVLQEDGNLVIYQSDRKGVVWASNTD